MFRLPAPLGLKKFVDKELEVSSGKQRANPIVSGTLKFHHVRFNLSNLLLEFGNFIRLDSLFPRARKLEMQFLEALIQDLSSLFDFTVHYLPPVHKERLRINLHYRVTDGQASIVFQGTNFQ